MEKVTLEPEPAALLVSEPEPVVMSDQVRESAPMDIPVGILVEFDGEEKDCIHAPFTGTQLLPMSIVNIIILPSQVFITAFS